MDIVLSIAWIFLFLFFKNIFLFLLVLGENREGKYNNSTPFG